MKFLSNVERKEVTQEIIKNFILYSATDENGRELKNCVAIYSATKTLSSLCRYLRGEKASDEEIDAAMEKGAVGRAFDLFDV